MQHGRGDLGAHSLAKGPGLNLLGDEAVALKGYVDGRLVLEFEDGQRPLIEGAIGIVVTEGRARVAAVSISPL